MNRLQSPFGRWISDAAKFILLAVVSHHAMAQEVLKAQPALFLNSNDHFGFELLRSFLAESQGRNVVLSPLPISLTFAALLDGAEDEDSAKEIRSAFYWDRVPALTAGAKIVLTRFQKPAPRPKTPVPVGMKHMSNAARRALLSTPETMWLSAAFVYRRTDPISPDFIKRVTYDTGIPFLTVGDWTSQRAMLAKGWDPSAPMPKVTGPRSFWITSSSHLWTAWAGNTFAFSKKERREFHIRPREAVSADFLKSELDVYPYAHTEEFDAVELPGKLATILLVLPAPASSIAELAAALASKPDSIEPLLSRTMGDVDLPPFHFTLEADLRPSIERMGVHRAFVNTASLLPMAPSMGGLLEGIAQKTAIAVDEHGIRADSGTALGGILGGVLAPPPEPFHMSLDRPFLFFIRDNVTKALLFEGAVTNPTIQ